MKSISAEGKLDPMKRPTQHILAGLLAAGVVLVLICGGMHAAASSSTTHVVDPILLAVVVASWLVWSFRGRLRERRHKA
ncbi:MAG: hypothetical protein NVSMB25_02080 [Thermoleophilaceae bacterium]